MFDLKGTPALLLGSTNGEIYFVRTQAVYHREADVRMIMKNEMC